MTNTERLIAAQTGENAMANTYTFERATYNGVKGWFCTRRVLGVYAGKLFGKTKAEAQAKFGD